MNVNVIEFYFQTNEVNNAQMFVLFVAIFTNYKCNNFRPPLVMFLAPKSVFFLLNVDVIFTGRNEVGPRLCFHRRLSFCYQGGVCLTACCDPPPEQTPPGSRHPPGSRPPGADISPGRKHPPEQTPPGSRHPPRSRHPLEADTPWSRHPPEQIPPRSRHPREQTPPRSDTPQD